MDRKTRLSKAMKSFIKQGFAFRDSEGKVLLTEKGIQYANKVIGLLSLSYRSEELRDKRTKELEEELEKLGIFI